MCLDTSATQCICYAGKDAFGWSMYIDHQRSWFLHDSSHHGRCDGGIGVGSRVRIQLDLEQGTLVFFVNGIQQVPLKFVDTFAKKNINHFKHIHHLHLVKLGGQGYTPIGCDRYGADIEIFVHISVIGRLY